MSKRFLQTRSNAGRIGRPVLAAVMFGVLAAGTALPSGGPVDAPVSNEPRVAVAKCQSYPGLMSSEGTFLPFKRVEKGEDVYSRDLLVAIPGFKVNLEPTSGAVKMTLWGNLPELSDSPVLESTVVLHDTKAYDLDFTLITGRVVLENLKDGPAKIWLRAEKGVQMVLPEKGDKVALEIYGRWPAGVPFKAKRAEREAPTLLWEVHCLKGKLEIKANKTEWYMTAAPGPAYFHGDSAGGAAAGGPEKRTSAPEWYEPKGKAAEMQKLIDDVVTTYTGRLKSSDPQEIANGLLELAAKDENKQRARVLRYIVVHAAAAIDDLDRVVELLGTSKHPEERKAAVIGLRHWIGEKEGRDDKLYEALQSGHLGYTKAEAETILQLLHSPFNPGIAETYDTLIAYLAHRKQAVRELAHWHLERLAPVGKDIKFDAADLDAAKKAAAEWKKLIPTGELPKDKPDDTKKK